MKKLILIVSFCAMLVSCKEHVDGDEFIALQMKYCVVSYIAPDNFSMQTSTNPEACILVDGIVRNRICYTPPEFGESPYIEKFLELAERNGDTSYNRLELFFGMPHAGSFHERGAYTENFSGIRVVCTNAAWDDAHPAGTPLDDLVRLSFASYHDYVQSGYIADRGVLKTRKAPAKLSETDLYMLRPGFRIFFDSYPTVGSFDLTVTLTTVDGVEKTGTCTMLFE